MEETPTIQAHDALHGGLKLPFRDRAECFLLRGETGCHQAETFGNIFAFCSSVSLAP